MPLRTALIALVLLAQPAPLDPALIRSTVESLSSVIGEEYFDVAVAAKIDAALKSGLTAGRYSLTPSLAALAGALNRELFAVSHDKHLNVAVKQPPDAAPPGGGPAPNRRDQPTEDGFRRVEILAGNIGYLDLTMFLRLTEQRDAIAAAI